MNQEVLKAINAVSKRLTEVEQKLDQYFLEKHEANSNSIVDTDAAVMELAELISTMTESKTEEEEQENGQDIS